MSRMPNAKIAGLNEILATPMPSEAEAQVRIRSENWMVENLLPGDPSLRAHQDGFGFRGQQQMRELPQIRNIDPIDFVDVDREDDSDFVFSDPPPTTNVVTTFFSDPGTESPPPNDTTNFNSFVQDPRSWPDIGNGQGGTETPSSSSSSISSSSSSTSGTCDCTIVVTLSITYKDPFPTDPFGDVCRCDEVTYVLVPVYDSGGGCQWRASEDLGDGSISCTGGCVGDYPCEGCYDGVGCDPDVDCNKPCLWTGHTVCTITCSEGNPSTYSMTCSVSIGCGDSPVFDISFTGSTSTTCKCPSDAGVTWSLSALDSRGDAASVSVT